MADDIAPKAVKDDEQEANPFVSGDPSSPLVDEDGTKKRRRTRSDAGKPRGPRGGRRASSLAKKISSAVAMVAAGVATVDPFDSAIILHNADRLGNAWAPVVEQNPKIAAFFASLEKGGVWGNAVFSTMAVALPILLHHRPDILPTPLRAVAVSMIPQEVTAMMVNQAAANGVNNGTG